MPDEVLYQGKDCEEIESAAELTLPDILTGMDADDNAINIEGVTWVSDPAFDPDVSIAYFGYVFKPVLPEGYMLAEGVKAPVITVFIRPEGGVGVVPLAAVPNNGSDGITDRIGVWAASDHSSVTINGNVTLDGNGSLGLYAYKAEIMMTGDITVTGTGSKGAWADGSSGNSSSITIDGTITAPTYIMVGGTAKTAAQYTALTTKPNYLTYTDGTNYVWVKWY